MENKNSTAVTTRATA